jgi:transcriptional regulator with XRE-family HTH domain
MQRPWVTSAAYDAAIGVVIDARKAKSLSQRDLADRLGKPRSFVSKIENKERRLDFLEFVVVARALGIAPEELLGQVDQVLPSKVEF